jgi:hypothetical protein
MKIVAVEISIDQSPDDPEENLGSPHSESFQLSLICEVDDTEDTGAAVKRLLADLRNRYEHLNARRTN